MTRLPHTRKATPKKQSAFFQSIRPSQDGKTSRQRGHQDLELKGIKLMPMYAASTQ